MESSNKTHKDTEINISKDALEELLMHSSNEIKRQRRERIFGRVLKISIVLLALGATYFTGGKLNQTQADASSPHIGYVEIYGPIMADQQASSDLLIPAITKAFDSPLNKAVVLRINSPGGSPVQANLIYKEILRLKALNPDKKIYASIEDLGASAAYFIAAATDKIFVDSTSMVGSIGVISSSFGYSEAMKKVGIERRVLTAGSHKAMFDPYLPQDQVVIDHFQNMLDKIHVVFIDAVKAGRKGKLDTSNEDIFSGLVWSGNQAVANGIADEIGSIYSISRKTVHKINIVNYTAKPDYMRQLSRSIRSQTKLLISEMVSPTLM